MMEGISDGASEGTEGIEPRCLNFLMRYCRVCWMNAHIHGDDWEDASQAVAAVLLERLATPAEWAAMTDDADSAERKELVRAIDRVTKRHQRAKRYGALREIADITDRIERERSMLWAAVERLMQGFSAFQQNILRLTRDGWGVQEIARELGRPVEHVSDEKYKAIRKLKLLLAA